MLNVKKQILFVSHAASMSGAPIVFLEIIKEFKKQSTIPFKIVVFEDGPLVKEFMLVGDTFIWKSKVKNKPAGQIRNPIILLFSIVVKRIKQYLRGQYILHCVRNSSLVFFNTIANGTLHQKMLPLKCKFVCYVHELEAAFHSITKPDTLKTIVGNTDLFLAVSEAVKHNLVINHSVAADKIKIFYPTIAQANRKKDDYIEFIESFKSKNQIPVDAVIIGVIASNEWRKGFDLFLPLVLIYLNRYPESNVRFVWKGFREDSSSSFYNLYDIEKFCLQKRALIIPHGNDGMEYISCFDIHLLLSREDPYPLVIQETASFGIPTVCFLGAGGSPEFIEQDSGICVPYGDLIKMADALNELAENDGLRTEMGRTAKNKVLSRHNQKKTTVDIIDTLLTL